MPSEINVMANTAARKILLALSDRQGFGDVISNLDPMTEEDIRMEIAIAVAEAFTERSK